MSNKKAYFNSSKEAEKEILHGYKAEPKLLDMPRYKEPLFHNYDLYNTEGVNGKAEHGPGTGYSSLHDYKNVADFLADKRKKSKTKYKSDNYYKMNNGSVVKARIEFLRAFIKTAIDFGSLDDVTPILPQWGTYQDSLPNAGMLDASWSKEDFEGKTPDNLNFGRDYIDDGLRNDEYLQGLSELMDEKYFSPSKKDKTLDQTLNGKEPSLYGLPDGINPVEDLDHVNEPRNDYGVTNSGNTVYENMWI